MPTTQSQPSYPKSPAEAATFFNVVLFPDFTLLDVFGPVEVIAGLKKEFQVHYFSENGGVVEGAANTFLLTNPM